MSFIFCCSVCLLGASIISVLWAFSSSWSVSSALLPTRPVVQHCVYCLGRNFYHMNHSLAVIPAYVVCVLLPRPQSSHKSSTLLIFIFFCSKKGGWKPQVWKESVVNYDKVFWLSFLSSSMCAYIQSTALSFLPKLGSNYTISRLFSPLSSSTTNRNLFINTSLVYVLYLPAVSPTKLVQKMLSFLPALQKQPRWCCPAKQADVTLVTWSDCFFQQPFCHSCIQA